ncbi:alpha-1,2-fucosyltransferase [Chitinophaga sp.]|uniref:alpha-1,2-fucosyltransferase n=1 Tax=Chitinophaga sp. TaxID=1869181 RepID=UPI00262F09BB|nr:alpha-1,2-fucosyltransferase [uncultured Chitinophaga sp.]
MILVQLKGGLGNQMFQYAAGRTLARQHDVPLFLDKDSYEPGQGRMYGLGGLHITANIAGADMIPRPGFLQKAFNRLAPASMRNVYREKHFHFDPAFFSLRPPVYLKGYWQSWKYFEPVKDLIREEFAFKTAFSPEILAKAQALRSSNSVAMHFRRGDYTSTSAAQYHGISEPEYYQKAAERYPGANFYIFTNDPAWVKDNLPQGIDYEILSGSLSHTQYEDLFLMSSCRHQVIANSSYSWWAAWLNRYEGKRITAPKRWFVAEGLHDGDLIPAGWDRI